ncbi:MAG: threonylcarbamoyl-AMP synthase [Verrucomicrobiae bacterium]|nr:threonylcarbamoyl-AMP synthase [Verrucomicrobiae bacterium]
MAQILNPTPENLDRLAAALAAGEIVAIPTETVYGLAGNALNPKAIRQIYEAKERPARNPLIVHIGDKQQLGAIAMDIPDEADRLIETWWPGPLTLILRKMPHVPTSVTAGLDSVAVRMPSHPVFRDLARRCSFPLAAPSANPFGYVSPTRASHVAQHMANRIDWILDGGPCERGLESTILSLVDPGKPILLRTGSISHSELEATLGKKIEAPNLNEAEHGEGLSSPGLMKRHYSPGTPVRLFEYSTPQANGNAVVVFLSKNSCTAENHFSLSESGNLSEVAQNLYDLLQHLDQRGFDIIFLELPPPSGLGNAIRDRMTRAASN